MSSPSPASDTPQHAPPLDSPENDDNMMAIVQQQQDENTSSSNDESKLESSWPCANCHSILTNNEQRCRICGGLQVKIASKQTPKQQQEFFLIAASPRLTPSPHTPQRPSSAKHNTSTTPVPSPAASPELLALSVPSTPSGIMQELGLHDRRPVDPVGAALLQDTDLLQDLELPILKKRQPQRETSAACWKKHKMSS